MKALKYSERKTSELIKLSIAALSFSNSFWTELTKILYLVIISSFLSQQVFYYQSVVKTIPQNIFPF